MNTNSKRADWKAHINEWSKSSLTQKAFCQQKGLSLASFGYWRKKLASKKRSSNLIPVTVSAPTTIRVRLHWGADKVKVRRQSAKSARSSQFPS